MKKAHTLFCYCGKLKWIIIEKNIPCRCDFISKDFVLTDEFIVVGVCLLKFSDSGK